jgi:opacity protein-like surface antigen
MKKLSTVLIALTIVLGVGGAACAAPYVSLNMGAAWVNDSDYSYSENGYDYTYRDNGEFTFDTGFVLNASFGNDFGNGFRAELEYGFRTNDLDKAEGTEYYQDFYEEDSNDYSDSLSGDIMTNSFMVNGFYDFAPRSQVSPFVGAGIGFANIEGDIDFQGKEDDNVFAYQFAAGMAFALNPKMKIDVQYRFFGTEDPDFYGLEAEYLTHNVMVGLRTSF